MVASIDLYKIFHCYYFWLHFGLTGFLGSNIVISITSAILLLRVSCPYSIFSGLIVGKDITTSMSKSMYSSMSVLEKRWSNNSWNSTSICINLITLFKTIQKAHAFHCILLKNTKVQTKKSQEEEMAVKEINIAFATPIPILIETTFTTFKYSSFSRGTMSTKTCAFPLLVMTCQLVNENDIMKMIRMPLPLCGMTVFQKRQSDIFR